MRENAHRERGLEKKIGRKREEELFRQQAGVGSEGRNADWQARDWGVGSG